MHFANTLRLSVLAVSLLSFTQAINPRVTQPETPSLTSTRQLSPPIAAAWMYLSDDLNYNTIPPKWSKIDFSTVDLLLIGPVGVQSNGEFGLYKSAEHGPLAKRFQWTIDTARSQNPAIKIIASQFWGGSPERWGNDLSVIKTPQDIEKYAASVQAFMKQWKQIDGYDVDYEAANVKENIGDIFRAVRDKLNQIQDGRNFCVSATPSETTYLKGAVPALDYVNMQNYAGGMALTTKDFLDLGFRPKQILYGFDAERPEDGHSIPEVEKEYTQGGLAGIHVWRLDSSDLEAEGQRQRQIAKFLHQGGQNGNN